MIKWQYMILLVDKLTNANIGVVGEKGWELVTVADGFAYFKRPIEEVSISDLGNAIEQAASRLRASQ